MSPNVTVKVPFVDILQFGAKPLIDPMLTLNAAIATLKDHKGSSLSIPSRVKTQTAGEMTAP